MTYGELILPSEAEEQEVRTLREKFVDALPRKSSGEIDYALISDALTEQFDTLTGGKLDLSEKTRSLLFKMLSESLCTAVNDSLASNPIGTVLFTSFLKSEASARVIQSFAQFGGTHA